MNNITIAPASEEDLPVIELLAKSFDLDCEEILAKQFLVAKKNNVIVGFGRLRTFASCTELATIGIVHEMRNHGIGSAIINELIRIGPSEIFVTCVIPDYFKKFGAKPVKKYPAVLQKKVDFCKLYDFKEESIFVMKLEKDVKAKA